MGNFPISRLCKGLAFFLVLGFFAFSVAACTPMARYKTLSFFFDGVPKPNEKPKTKKTKKFVAKNTGPKNGTATTSTATEVLPEPKRPPIETVKEWEEVLKFLPKDLAGGADWVLAVKKKIIAPRGSISPNSLPEPPLTLDTLVPALSGKGGAPLDLNIEIIPPKLPLFKVVFPHSSHTLWLNCSSCHPGIVKEQGGMANIFAGKYCGKCHGKVSFAPKTGCPRCHSNLVPTGEKEIQADLAKAKKNPMPASPKLIAQGKKVYLEACAVCHGEKGDGKGALDKWLNPKARDFRQGKYKFRSTSSESLVRDFDIFRTITVGVLGTTMPSWSRLSYEDRWSLVHFVKTFSERFKKEKPNKEVPIPNPLPKTNELMAAGKTMYSEAGCNKCHGNTGGGDGPSAVDLKDDWGQPLRPYNFRGGISPKGGHSIQDVYRAVMTGLQGTPMPDFGEIFEEQKQAWGVVHYVYSIIEERRKIGFGLKGDIRFDRASKVDMDKMPPALFPHWFHRIRFKCTACHPKVFKMKAGGNKVSMDAILKGKFCGACHNGNTAWLASFENCHFCHVREK